MTNYHLTMPIDSLLSGPDEDLKTLFDRPPADLRKELEEKKAAGEVFIPSPGCEGFDPKTGCPGHDA